MFIILFDLLRCYVVTDLTHDSHAATTGPEPTTGEIDDGEMSIEEQAEAKRYSKVSLACTLADLGIDVA